MLSLYILLESGVYEPLSKDCTSNIEKKVQKLLSKHKIAIKHKLSPYHRKPSHLYYFPKIHKPRIFSNLLSLHPSLVQIFPSTPCSFLNVRDEVSHPYNLIYVHVVYLTTQLRKLGQLVHKLMNWKGIGRNRSWPISSYYPENGRERPRAGARKSTTF
jgi:hypothetical protein